MDTKIYNGSLYHRFYEKKIKIEMDFIYFICVIPNKMNCETNKMNCEHCEKKLPELYYTDNVYMTKVNEVGQTVDAGKKELYFCNYECACKRHEHFSVKEKMKIIKMSKKNAEDLEEIYEDGDTILLILIHFYKAIINFIRGKITEEKFKIISQKAMEVGEDMGDSVYLSIVRDTQYALIFMNPKYN
jgi:hypothetical protein